jgi:4-hydroxy-tetrahydrodipicolinate reductase
MWSSNYSIGVNILFALNQQLAKFMEGYPTYTPHMTEVHHIHKKDAPSGTAITLAEGILENIDRKVSWENPTVVEFDDEGEPIVHSMGEAAPENIAITSLREGETPGIHTVTYDSEDDMLQIMHIIKNRRTLAMGAVIAAEFLCGKKGCFSMDDLLQ